MAADLKSLADNAQYLNLTTRLDNLTWDVQDTISFLEQRVWNLEKAASASKTAVAAAAPAVEEIVKIVRKPSRLLLAGVFFAGVYTGVRFCQESDPAHTRKSPKKEI
jgi:hypothetical protein